MPAEEGKQVKPAPSLEVVESLFVIDLIIGLHIFEEVSDRDSGLSRTNRNSSGNITFANRQKPLRVGLPRTVRAFSHSPTIAVVLDPPNFPASVNATHSSNLFPLFVLFNESIEFSLIDKKTIECLVR